MEKLNTLIQTEEELEILVRKAKKTDAVALDTEFVWERTYYPQLGLIQLALSDEECYLIDPLAIANLEILGRLLSDRSVIKIFHDAPQDLTILYRATGATTQNIFDTRLAAGFAGLSSTLSLANLSKEVLDIELSKEETRTNWLNRPLSDDQVRYALDDVRYLRAIRILLLTRIIGPKLKSWLQEELNILSNPADYIGPQDSERFRKIRGSNLLDTQGLAILKNLSTWREGMAKKRNRPRGHIVHDSILLEAAKNKPNSTEQLKTHTAISGRALASYGDTIAAIIETTRNQSPRNYPEVDHGIRLNAREKTSYDRLTKLIDLKSELLGLDPGLVGNTSELKKLTKILAAQDSSIPQQLRQTEGWRKEFIADFFHSCVQSC